MLTLPVALCPPLCCRGDCTHFGLPDPELPLLGQLQEEIDSHDRMWALYDQFYSGLGELTQQDWLSFRLVATEFHVFFSLLSL